MNEKEYPQQPVHFDDNGVIRFEANPIIEKFMLNKLNDVAIWCQQNNIDAKYQEQLAQLIGYSVSGYGSLSYVTDHSYARAHAASNRLRHGVEE